MRFALILPALFASLPEAHAGGIGPLVMGGIHTEPLYYYSSRRNDGAGANIPDAANYPQYKQTQILGHVGSGLELMLGDRDDLIQGAFRVFWMMDTPQIDPSKNSELSDPAAVVAEWRSQNRHMGVGTVGLQWGVLRAAADKFKFGFSLHVGTGFLTNNRTEFFLFQPGVNISYAINRTLEFYTDVDYGLRVRKQFSHGLYATAGIRVMFD